MYHTNLEKDPYGLCYICAIPELILVNGELKPNPDYDENLSTHYAYFGKDGITGEDWDKIPYETYSKPPKGAQRLTFKMGDSGKVRYVLAHQQSITKGSPYSVNKINCGMVPWLFAYDKDNVLKFSKAIYAGTSMLQFVQVLDQIKQYNEKNSIKTTV